MRFSKQILAVVFLLLALHGAALAQMTKDNSVWTFDAHRATTGNVEIGIHVTLEKGWHIMSLTPGGDGTLMPPKFEFTPNSMVTLRGGVKESGQLISQNIDGIAGNVHMYKNKVDYIQVVTITGATTVNGTYTYQVCNDKLCLPPVTRTFSVAVK